MPKVLEPTNKFGYQVTLQLNVPTLYTSTLFHKCILNSVEIVIYQPTVLDTEFPNIKDIDCNNSK